MAKLPSMHALHGFTDQTIVSVAGAYVDQLGLEHSKYKREDCEETIRRALRTLEWRSRRKASKVTEHENTITALLKRVPHCLIPIETEFDGALIDWLDFQEMAIEFVWVGDEKRYILFDTEEERVLFKLRWL